MNLLSKFRGDSARCPPRPSIKAILLAFIGGFIAIATVALLTENLNLLLILGSFGASCVLIFGYPDVPFSQPRNVVFGHLISSLIGLAFFHYVGDAWWSLSLAVGSAIAAMMLFGVVHPPAGSNPVIVFLTAPAWNFALFPTLCGAVILVLVALLYHNLTRKARWPKYW